MTDVVLSHLRWEGESSSPFDWLRLVHAPGHTPGACVALIESRGSGAAFLTGLLHRDDSLADETTAIDVARRLADELADRPHENPTEPTESGARR